ncbi:MAG: hypothetical protein IJ642_03435 [Oscillospiraceae bacterium]|nr:hypothetical protein [Oscillospiraceae bacterium]
MLYLGGTDLETVRYISKRVRHSMETVMEMPLNRVYYMERGKKGVLADKLVPYACVTVSTEETIDQQFDKRTEQIMDVSEL